MKRLLGTLIIVAAGAFLAGTPLLAAENTMDERGQRNECLLVAMNCGDNVDTIQQRIERLNKEIAKGTDVYTRDELNILNKKLEETEKLLEYLTTGG